MNNTAIITLTTVTLLTVGISLNTVEAAPDGCLSKYVSEVGGAAGEIEETRVKRAKHKATKAWQEKVAKRHSKRYSNFENAYNAFFSCRLNAFGGTTCIVTALPCSD
jgi:hypothetical protein